MNPQIVIFAANGFMGRYLARHYQRQGREVVCVARHREGWSGDGMFLEWDGRTEGPWALALEGAERVINLAGRSVNCRYDERNRREIIESRVASTSVIGQAIAACRIPPKLWMNASTATIYRHAEDRAQDEWEGEPGDGFSMQVARAWEEAFFAAKVPGLTRKVALRAGMVLANEYGTVFEVLRHLTRRGLGGTMGNGKQRVSWIHMDDLLAAIDFIAADPLLDGVFNLTAPEFPSNRELMRAFREQQGAPLRLASRALDVGDRCPLAEDGNRAGPQEPLGRSPPPPRGRFPLALAAT
ncbi:NAD-dependent epimerase/dehydratase family protein [Haloferula sp. BvORR071]|uniref:epimerase n=1 Tax=Haloferula sp. BvORR071 TaxID=1396141 RepID=UPI0009463649|nr:NAD-dependent epimerase/dehydratase family protein [Haloferula sp. BvORR071]